LPQNLQKHGKAICNVEVRRSGERDPNQVDLAKLETALALACYPRNKVEVSVTLIHFFVRIGSSCSKTYVIKAGK
jgi:hypothetical protein